MPTREQVRPRSAPVADAIDVELRDGSSIHIRAFQRADRDPIRAFFAALSSDSIGFRFFGMPNLDWMVNWSVRPDPDRYALIATGGTDPAIIAHGVYIGIGSGRAEVAFVVADQWQEHGIATIMLLQLAAVARQHRISVFTADVMPGNHRMIEVFRDSGFPVAMRAEQGAIKIELSTSHSTVAPSGKRLPSRGS